MYRDGMGDMTKELAGRLKLGDNMSGFRFVPAAARGGAGSASSTAGSTQNNNGLFIVVVRPAFSF